MNILNFLFTSLVSQNLKLLGLHACHNLEPPAENNLVFVLGRIRIINNNARPYQNNNGTERDTHVLQWSNWLQNIPT